ncbi:MAG: hypothetical protein CUN55_17740 [Phototrophicales bacterium]|nr:MAG: hypothetical protein CUN55_17740 [Phototrophicales bacterium]
MRQLQQHGDGVCCYKMLVALLATVAQPIFSAISANRESEMKSRRGFGGLGSDVGVWLEG